MITYRFLRKNKWQLLLLLLLLWHFCGKARAQSPLSLEECYNLARQNYPVIKKLNLIGQSADFNIGNANKKYLPQLSFSGQATYQSETINFSEALGTSGNAGLLPVISKDQYKIQGEVNQLLYDGGATHYQKDLIKANSSLQEQNLEASLYLLKQRINNIYFSILLMDAQLKQNELNKAVLQTQIGKTEAALKNGTAFKSSLNELEAEIINIDMAGTEYKNNRIAYLHMLSLFIDQELSDGTQLQIPEVDGAYNAETITRPELKTFDLQQSVYDIQQKQLKSGYLPSVSLFFQGAYGRPTLNIIENKFGPWYIAGARFSWSLSSLYSLSGKKSILNLNRQAVDADRETFLLNTRLDLAQQDGQVRKFNELIHQDNEAIALRTAVTKSADAQLENGVITTHEYIQKLNAEHLAKQMKIFHEIQLLQAQYTQKFIKGN